MGVFKMCKIEVINMDKILLYIMESKMLFISLPLAIAISLTLTTVLHIQMQLEQFCISFSNSMINLCTF